MKEEAWQGVLEYDAEITKFFIMLRTQTVVLIKDSSDINDTHNFNTISITKHKATKTKNKTHTIHLTITFNKLRIEFLPDKNKLKIKPTIRNMNTVPQTSGSAKL